MLGISPVDMVGTTNEVLEPNYERDEILRKQLEEVIDHELQELGFAGLCKKIAFKVMEKVQKIDNEHNEIKSIYGELGIRLANLLFEPDNEELPQFQPAVSMQTHGKRSDTSSTGEKCIIVIDDDDDADAAKAKNKSSISKTRPSVNHPAHNQSSMEHSEFCVSSHSDISQCCSSLHISSSTILPRSNVDVPSTARNDRKSPNDSTVKPRINSQYDQEVIVIDKSNESLGQDMHGNKSADLIGIRNTATEQVPPFHTVEDLSLCSKPNLQQNETHDLSDNINFEINDLSPTNEVVITHTEVNTFLMENHSFHNLSDEELVTNTMRSRVKQSPSVSAPSGSSHSLDLTDTGSQSFSVLPTINVDDSDLQSRTPLILKLKVTEKSTTEEITSKYSSTMVSHHKAKTLNKDLQLSETHTTPNTHKRKEFKFREGAVVYAKPFGSDIWFEAELLKEIVNNNSSKKQSKFQVRFMAGQRVRQKISQKCMASKDTANEDQIVLGTRIVAGRPSDTVNTTISKKYKDISSGNNINVMFAGVVAELACEANRYRYLVFFDDGYAQYFTLNSLFLVLKPSYSVWNDVAVDCQEFIKEYLQDYPYRPLVCTTIGNTMQTEWNGEWWKSKVVSIDASLVKILFDVDKRSEWIYRGTTRLEPLYNYFIQPKPAKKKKKYSKSQKEDFYVDEKITHPQFGISKYSLKDPEGVLQRKEWNVPSVKLKRSSGVATSSQSDKYSGDPQQDARDKIMPKKLRVQSGITSPNGDKEEKLEKETISSLEAFGALGALQMSPTGSIASSASHKSISSTRKTLYSDDENIGETINFVVGSQKSVTGNLQKSPSIDVPMELESRGPHTCSQSCIKDTRKLMDQHRHGIYNYLAIPFVLGWKRESSKKKTGWHRDIYYRSPCNRRLRNLAEITNFILLTKCTNVCIDMFCFQSNISCRNQPLKPRPPLAKIDDLSGGKEICPIVCVNEMSEDLPNPIVYISSRLKAEDVSINTDPGFLVCCDCTDNCQDKSKCGCAQLTIESSNAIDDVVNPNAGYQYRRLKETITTGIYECNQNCSCSRETCYNRVVQNGIQLRLQVFMTPNRGWGLRCVDDIPKGTFICTYTGQVLNEQTANKEGMDFGDEYLAELDHIEVVEKAKDGYESDVPELRENIINSSDDDSDSDCSGSVLSISSDTSSESEEEYICEEKVCSGTTASIETFNSNVATESTDSSPSIECGSLEWDKEKSYLTPCHVPIQRIPSAEWPSRLDSMSDDSISTVAGSSPKVDTDLSGSLLEALNKEESKPISNDLNEKLLVNVPDKEISSDISIHNGSIGNDLSTFSGKAVAIKSTTQKAYAHKSTGGKISVRISAAGQQDLCVEKAESTSLSTRSMYDGDKQMYVIDAKCFGNVGRFMNHSCSPNLFVQNVMVDTHDLRFPWVAFFAQQNIPSYNELTWDYNYEIGSVPGKQLICKCGSKVCKGRLL